MTDGKRIAAGYSGYMVGKPLKDLATEIDEALEKARTDSYDAGYTQAQNDMEDD